MISQIIQQQLDYVYFCYGLAFFIFAVTCMMLGRGKEHGLHWAWLTHFGFAIGLSEWLELLMLDLGDTPVFSAIRFGVLTLAFTFLFEFARSSYKRMNPKGPGPWIYIQIAACIALGGFGGIAGLNTIARYLLAFVGGIWAAVVLNRESKIEKKPVLSILATVMAVYAVTAGLVVPTLDFFPASVINNVTFYTATGIPIQVIRASLAVIMIAALWRYYQQSEKLPSPDDYREVLSSYGLRITLALLAIVIAGWLFTQNAGNSADRDFRQDILNQTTIATSAITPGQVMNLNASPADRTLPGYIRLRQQLIDMNLPNPHLRRLYLLVQRDGKILYAIDSISEALKNHNEPGTPYEYPPKELLVVFASGQPVTSAPYTDENGIFISGFAALKDPFTQKIVGVLGLDTRADDWQDAVINARLVSISVTLLICLLCTGFFIIRQRLWESSARIEANEKGLLEAQRVMHIGNWFLNLITNQLTWTEEMYRIFQVDPAAGPIPFSDLRRFIHPSELDQVNEAIQKTTEEGSECELETRIILANNSVRTVVWKVEARHNGKGEPVQLFGTVQDITERKQVEDALMASEEEARLLFESASDPILLIDDGGHFVDCNAAAVEILGVASKDQILGKNTSNFSPERQPDGELSFEKEERMKKLANAYGSSHFEWMLLRSDGSEFTVGVSLTIIIMGDKKVQLAHWRDMTENVRLYKEIQREKEYFESLMTNNPAATLVIDMQNKVISWNPAAFNMFGYNEAEAVGREVNELVAMGEMRDEAAIFNTLAAKGELVHTITRRNRRDGSLVDVELSAVPVVIEGKQIGTIVIYHDITELRQARQAAEAANESKSAFLANMSHEIRTPLNAIIGMTSLLKDTKLNPEQRDFADTIRTSGDVLLTLINDILDFSKIEAQKMDLECQPFNLRHCVEEALDLLAAKAADKKIDLAYTIEDNLPAFIIGDAARLRQILVNLLSNGIKFTDAGEVVVSVSGNKNESVMNELQFSVKDSGLGIPPDRAHRLFQSFSQIDASTTRKFGGTGLGLAISKRLTEMMGGKIWMESSGIPGLGSTFYFTIQAEAAPQQESTEAMLEEINLADKKILIVDDNATSRQILNNQLSSWGIQTTPVSSALDALALIRKGAASFDLALLDNQMPVMDGQMLAEEIRKDFSAEELPLILLATVGYREVRSGHKQFAACLYKPIKPSQLHDSLVSVITKKSIPARRGLRQGVLDHDLGKKHPLSILVAEDNVVNLKVALSLLDRLGYQADVAQNGLEVLDALKRQPYDIIFMDGQMPEMDGEEATKIIREAWPPEQQPHIIAMTADALHGDRERYLKLGMDDYVSKPIRVDDLIRALTQSRSLSEQKNEPVPGTESNNQPAANSAFITSIPELTAGSKSVDFDLLEEFKTMMGDDGDEVVRDLIALYIKNVPSLFEELRQAILVENAGLVQRMAHKLKGNSSQIGAIKMSMLCAALEILGRDNLLDGAEAKLGEIESEFENVTAELKAGLNIID